MTRLLIVEDDVNKREQLHRFVVGHFSEIVVDDAESLIGGIRKLRTIKPDVVLLDMTLPNYDPEPGESGGGMQAFGGEEFLRQCKRLKLEPGVIVVTQFETFGEANEVKGREELDSELSTRFPRLYKGMVYYHASLSSWTQELEVAIRRVLGELSANADSNH
jgi:CheY-like chemotaxis protein